MNGRLLTIDQVAEYLGVHRDTVYNLVRSGRLPALQLGGRKAGWRIAEEDVREFVSAGKAANATSNSSNERELADFDRQQSDDLDSFRQAQERSRNEFLTEHYNKVRK